MRMSREGSMSSVLESISARVYWLRDKRSITVFGG